MKKKVVRLLAVSEVRWLCHGMIHLKEVAIADSQHCSCAVALIFSETAAAAWRAAGSLYDTVSESILRVRFKLHIMASVADCCISPTNGPSTRVRQGRL